MAGRTAHWRACIATADSGAHRLPGAAGGCFRYPRRPSQAMRTRRIISGRDGLSLAASSAASSAASCSRRSPSRAGCSKALTKLPGVECLIANIDEPGALLTGNPEHVVGKNASYGWRLLRSRMPM
jgi:hypothetical protein